MLLKEAEFCRWCDRWVRLTAGFGGCDGCGDDCDVACGDGCDVGCGDGCDDCDDCDDGCDGNCFFASTSS